MDRPGVSHTGKRTPPLASMAVTCHMERTRRTKSAYEHAWHTKLGALNLQDAMGCEALSTSKNKRNGTWCWHLALGTGFPPALRPPNRFHMNFLEVPLQFLAVGQFSFTPTQSASPNEVINAKISMKHRRFSPFSCLGLGPAVFPG